MYLTKLHKSILTDIWKVGNQKLKEEDSSNRYDLYKFLEFCLESKYEIKGVDNNDSDSENKNINYCDYPYSKGKFVFNPGNKDKFIIMAKEFTSLVKYLYVNDLVEIVNIKNSVCPPLFFNEGENIEKPFIEALKILQPYIGKEILVREGYKEFKRHKYRTHEEMLRRLIGWLMPAVGIITALVNLIIALFIKK